MDDIEVVEPIQVLKDQEKIYSHDENEFKHYLKVDINEIEVIDPMHIIPYVSLGNNSYSKNAEDNLDKEKDIAVNPIDSPIVDGMAKRTEQRRIKLKEFNYKFTKSKLVSDMESEILIKEPA